MRWHDCIERDMRKAELEDVDWRPRIEDSGGGLSTGRHRQRVMFDLVSQVPSAHALLVFPRTSLVLAWLALTKGGGIAVALVRVVLAVMMLCSACCHDVV